MNIEAVRGRDINPNDKFIFLSLEWKIINKTSNAEQNNYIFKSCNFFSQFTILRHLFYQAVAPAFI